MKILLHACCGPCTIHPLEVLRSEDNFVMGYFFRSNIHPFSECLKREETLAEFAQSVELPMVWQQGYDMEGFLRKMVFRESNRCQLCYHARLKAAAMVARKGKFDAFTSTLLYSKFQKHDLIKEMGEAIGKQYGVRFLYRDFRDGWKHGIEESRRLGMYRQQYCGCIYSEKDRFYNERHDRRG